MKFYMTLILFISSHSWAYTPTLESLLRNGNNVDIANNSVVANLKIQKIPGEKSGEQNTNAIVQSEVLKLLIYNEREDYPKLVQLQYVGNKISNKNMHDIKVIPFHSLKSISKNTENIEQRLLYSVLAMLLRNDGRLLIDFLREQGIKVPTNRELVNKEKLRLLRDYRQYLKKVSDTTDVSEIKNPLRPSEEEEQVRVEEIMKTPYLQSDNLVKRFKNGDYFNWIVETEKLYISFDENHRLEELSLKLAGGTEVKVTCGRFLLQGSNLEFPESLTLTASSGAKYQVSLSSLSMFTDNSKAYFRRLEKYRKDIQENNINNIPEKLNIIL